MEEVEVQPRDLYLHYINVPTVGKTIQWWFSTKNKNISFGLYWRRNNLQSGNSQNNNQTQTHQKRPSEAGSFTFAPPQPPFARSQSGSASRGSISVHSVDSGDESSVNGENDSNVTGTSQIPSSQKKKPRRKSSGAVTLKRKDPDLIEILPIEHYQSASATVKGSYAVEEAGTYVLCFDNTFSRTTPKHLTFTITLTDATSTAQASSANSSSSPQIAGWLLKKKRKKMQGWAKRYFVLSNGTLTYHLTPTSIARGSIHIVLSTITVNPAQKMIHIDSGVMLYHLKAITEEDFEMWVAAVRDFKTLSVERGFSNVLGTGLLGLGTGAVSALGFARATSLRKMRSDGSFTNLRSSTEGQIPNSKEAEKAATLLKGMELELQAAKEAIEGLREMKEFKELVGKSNKTVAKEQLDKDNRDRGNNIEGGRFRLKLPGRPTKQLSSGELPTLSTVPPSSNSSLYSSSNTTTTSTPSTPISFSSSSASTPPDTLVEKISDSLNKLWADKDNIYELLHRQIEQWKRLEREHRRLLYESDQHKRKLATQGRHSSDVDEVEEENINTFDETEDGIDKPDPGKSVYGFQHRRTGSFTSATLSLGSEIFFDALDDAEVEFISGGSSDDEVANSKTDAESDILENAEGSEEITTKQIKELSPTTSGEQQLIVHRRALLPSPICGDDISIVAIMRKNVGKDLSTIAMPVSLNEPLNLLQRLAEELEYSELLDKAAACTDSLERLMYVSIFMVSGYTSTQFRAGRKPFNPLHGETYECIREDLGWKFISEKVSHNPPVMACHAESKNFVFWQDSKGKSKFWGRSMEVAQAGTVHITLPAYPNDHYTYGKPTTWMRNMLAGTKYLEHTGEVRLTNHGTNEYAILLFKEATGFFGTTGRNEVVITLHAANGSKKRTLTGRWNENIAEELGKDRFEIRWRTHELIKDYENWYGFTQFAIELNEITEIESGKLPWTDTRLRPDQRLFEEGKVPEADAEKLRVEQQQRNNRKQLEAAGKEWQTQWFERQSDPYAEGDGKETWVYKGGYWEARKNQDWGDIPKLW